MLRRISARRRSRLRRDDHASSGFSVMEMMIVVTVILVVAAIGLPGLLNQLSKVRLEAAAAEVANLIQQTRLRAIRDNQTHTVEVSGSRVVGEVVFGNSNQDTFDLEFNNPPIAVYPGGGIAECQNKYDGTGSFWGGTSIVYDATGVAGDTGAICVWDGGENILQVVVDFPAGPPSVRKYQKAGDSVTGSGGFIEKTSAATSDNTWVWY